MVEKEALMKATRSGRLQDFFMGLLDASVITNGPLPTAEWKRRVVIAVHRPPPKRNKSNNAECCRRWRKFWR